MADIDTYMKAYTCTVLYSQRDHGMRTSHAAYDWSYPSRKNSMKGQALRQC